MDKSFTEFYYSIIVYGIQLVGSQMGRIHLVTNTIC